MKIRHADLAIDEKNPFATCQLGRKKYADTLTSIVETYADGFVLAINNEWGTGKTTFVKMWKRSLELKEFRTLYFNAWEHDFDHDPMVAVLAALKSLKEKESKAFESVVEKAGILARRVIPEIVKAVAALYIKTEGVSEAIKELTQGAVGILDQEIEEYTSKKQTLKSFQDELEKYVKEQCDGKPLVFIIDELDRCRPNYAVEVLEKVKHFFSVPGIVFVLSIDKEQLGHAVKGVYGSAGMNSDEYLRRFIDLEYAIPPPDYEGYCKHLYKYFEFAEFFNAGTRMQHHELRDDGRHFVSVSSLLIKKFRISLRKQERIFAYLRVLLLAVPKNYYTFPHILCGLVYIKILDRGLFDKISRNSLSLQQLIDEFYEFIPDDIDNSNNTFLSHLEAELLYRYYIRNKKALNVNLVDSGVNPKKLIVTPRFDRSPNFQDTVGYIEYCRQQFRSEGLGIDYVLSLIEMTDSFNEH